VQGNVSEETVAEIIRELLHQMVWFADVMIYAFLHVAKGLSEEFRQSSLGYRSG
jgi:phage gp29-like protein